MKRCLWILIILGVLLSACAAGEEDASLIGRWELAEYGPEGSLSPALTENEPGLTFNEDGTLGGSSGCNGFSGEYTVAGNQIEFGPITSTLMLCDSPVMGQEEAFFQVLRDTAAYEIEGNTLTISNNGYTLVLVRAQAE